ncbi:MAG: rhodanese-like domain-containing protein [Desertifilum sp. SIO1I2]|nr:rhodanese-like domain-containing protein [Desertifilum sp. SIO1I2]
MVATYSSAWNDQLQAIDATTLKCWLDQNRVTLVDVREPGEFAGERIVGAIHKPLSSLVPAEIQAEPGKQLVLYCQSSNRSAQAAQKLFAAGFSDITHLQGGLNAWKAASYPTYINPKAPISLMRQVQIVAGSFVLIGTLLGAFVSPGFLAISGFVGAGLVFAGVSGTCALGMLLAKLPYNRRA